jgi:hypothetical protein
MAARMRQIGLSADKIAFVLGIGPATYWRWRRDIPSFKKMSAAPEGFRGKKRSDRTNK